MPGFYLHNFPGVRIRYLHSGRDFYINLHIARSIQRCTRCMKLNSHWKIFFFFVNFKPTVRNNPHWARVVGYGPFSLCVIHKEGLCPSSGDINRLVMMMSFLILCNIDSRLTTKYYFYYSY
jgi:hypothetical protein